MIGQTIAHYRILEQLGQGGMGIVYKAEDTRLRRIVALKFLPESLRRDASAREQFLREARAASQLKHPNVLTIYTVEESPEGDFIAMEFAESGTLRERIGTLSIAQIIDFMAQAAAGLHAAHERGIVHRDIKPDNLLIDAEGRLRISDFGLARVASDDSGALHSDVAVGTAHYMSPEQVTGAKLDPRSDIFSLGVTFFELTAKRRPFEGDYVMSVLYAIANDQAPPLSEFEPSVPSEFESVIARCLAKSPEDRFASSRELADTLRGVGSDASPVHAAPALKPSEADSRPLIGRSAELESIGRVLRSAATGNGRTVILTGEPGVGKTRLAEAVMTEGRQLGMGVLSGRCLPQGGGLPFHAYTHALRSGLPRLNDALVGSLERRAAALGIDLRNRLPVIKMFLNMSGNATVMNQEQLWDSLLVLLRIISAEKPVILFLDDLQWADEDTLRFFGFIARSSTDLPLVQLATVRVFESPTIQRADSQSVTDLTKQLHGDGFADWIEVERLTVRDTIALASELLGSSSVDTELAETIARRTDGNPLFICELVELLRNDKTGAAGRGDGDAQVPGRVRDIISQRIVKLDPPDRELLEFAACETDFFDSEIILECLGGERIPLLRTLQRLEAVNHLLKHDGPKYRFDHPLIREVIYDALLPELQVEYHRLIAKSVAARHAGSAEHASRIAHHLIASGQPGESVPYLLRAAERSRELFANSEAFRLFAELESIVAEVNNLSPDDRMRFALGFGDVLHDRGNVGDAQARYEECLRIARMQGSTGTAIDCLRRLSSTHRVLGDLDGALELGRTAVEEARTYGDERRLIEALTRLAAVHVPRAEYDQTLSVAEEARERCERANDSHNRSIALSLIGAAHMHRGEYRRASESLTSAISMQRSFGDQKGLASSLNFSGLALHRMAKFSVAIAHHEESLRIKRTIQDVSAIPGSLNALGDVLRDSGQVARALEVHSQSLELSRQHGNRAAECDNLRDLAVDHLLLGDRERGHALLTDVIRISREFKYLWYESRALSALSELNLARGELRQAAAASTEALNLAKQIGALEPMVEASLASARVIIEQSENIDTAAALLREGIRLAESGDLTLPLPALHFVLSQILHRMGDDPGAHASLQSARRYLMQAAESIDDGSMRQVYLNTPLSVSIIAETG